jgi:hypothetical protein
MSRKGKLLLGIFISITILSVLATIYKGLVGEDFLVITDVTTE